MKVYKVSTLKTAATSHYSKTLGGQIPEGSNLADQSRHRSKQYERRPRRTSRLKAVAVGTVGFALALVAWEGILRLTVEVSQGISDHPLNPAHPRLDTSTPLTSTSRPLRLTAPSFS